MLPLQFFYVLLALVASFVVAVPLAEDGDSVNAMTPYHLNMSGKVPTERQPQFTKSI